MRTTVLCGLLLGLGGCPPPGVTSAPLPPVSTGKVRVRVFTEPSPVRMVVAAERFVFVATGQDLERFDDGGGVFTLSSMPGQVAGGQVVALGPDPERKVIWIVTDRGVGRYETQSETYSEVAEPPASIGLDFATLAKDGATIAAAHDGGAWLGTSKGLLYVSKRGGWQSTPIKEPIRTLSRDHANWLWIATTTGLITRKPNGDTAWVGHVHGNTVTQPRMLVEMPGDRMMVIGADDKGHERIAIGKELAWTTFRALPDARWDAVARRGAGAIMLGGGRIYQISVADETRVRPLVRDGMRLVAVTGGKAAAGWMIDPIDVVVPPGATSLGVAGDQLLIGTRDLGTARFRLSSDGRAQPRDWLRSKQMFHDATTLTVACVQIDDCWIATGARHAWRWTGERFIAAGPEPGQVVLAVVRDREGGIYGLHRGADQLTVQLSRIDRAGVWTAVDGVELATPGAAPEISFARFSTSGALWVGLRYRDGLERRAFGTALIDVAAGRVSYHRTGATSDDPDHKAHPIPIGVTDGDVRGETAWFATSEGVARLASGELQVWTEADGLRSELGRAVTIAPNGRVIVATSAGAAIWNGKGWDFPAALRFELNDVVATRSGQVWMATERGIAAWDGSKVRRVDTRRGLAENEILDVAVDQFDRVWARGAGSLTLISQ